MSEVSYAERLRLRRAAVGMTQRDLAEASGVKQPLIAVIESGKRLPTEAVRQAIDGALRVRPSQLLAVARDRVLAAVAAAGGTEARVFGSVASGNDQPDSDLDLMVRFPPGADIVTLLTLEEELTDLLTVPVDVVSAGSSGPLRDGALAQSVPL